MLSPQTALATPERSPSNHPHITNTILKLRIGVPCVCQDLPFHPFVIDSKCIKLGAALPTLIAVEIDGYMKTFFPPILILLPMRTSHSSGSTFFDLRQTITTVKTIRHLPPLSNRFEQSPKITNTTCSFYILQPGSSHPPLGWVRGPGRHGGEAAALCDGSDDVGEHVLHALRPRTGARNSIYLSFTK